MFVLLPQGSHGVYTEPGSYNEHLIKSHVPRSTYRIPPPPSPPRKLPSLELRAFSSGSLGHSLGSTHRFPIDAIAGELRQ